jgi:large subunit ribosomal protein L17
MRHQKHGRKFGRVRRQRTALMKTMLGSLIMREKISTTEAKAKELKIKIDPIINKAKRATSGEKKNIGTLRDLGKHLPMMAVKKLSGDFLEKFSSRQSGYARVIKLPQRKSDGAKVAVIEFV